MPGNPLLDLPFIAQLQIPLVEQVVALIHEGLPYLDAQGSVTQHDDS